MRARVVRARTSFGRQEPPKAKPGLHVVGREVQPRIVDKMFITTWLSTPRRLQRLPISFANDTLTAWNALRKLLTMAAASGWCGRAARSARRKSAPRRRRCGRQLADGERRVVEVIDGRALAQELGVLAEAEVAPGLLARAFSSTGMTVSWKRPAISVERMTMRSRPAARAAALADLLADAPARSRVLGAVRQRGVPTQTKRAPRREAATPSAARVVAESSPARTPAAVNSSRPASTNGARPGSERPPCPGADVHPGHLMAILGQARRGNAADVAQTENAYSHVGSTLRGRELTGGRGGKPPRSAHRRPGSGS